MNVYEELRGDLDSLVEPRHGGNHFGLLRSTVISFASLPFPHPLASYHFVAWELSWAARAIIMQTDHVTREGTILTIPLFEANQA